MAATKKWDMIDNKVIMRAYAKTMSKIDNLIPSSEKLLKESKLRAHQRI
jgi:hypothetical protein